MYIVKESRNDGYTVRIYHPTILGGWSEVLAWFTTRMEARAYIQENSNGTT